MGGRHDTAAAHMIALATSAFAWQPIETAPPVRDQKTYAISYLVTDGVEVWKSEWLGEEGWEPEDDWSTEPTHWMPLPTPPARGQP